jgi:hypothetical protein
VTSPRSSTCSKAHSWGTGAASPGKLRPKVNDAQAAYAIASAHVELHLLELREAMDQREKAGW